jgi:hypothetical protein
MFHPESPFSAPVSRVYITAEQKCKTIVQKNPAKTVAIMGI